MKKQKTILAPLSRAGDILIRSLMVGVLRTLFVVVDAWLSGRADKPDWEEGLAA